MASVEYLSPTGPRDQAQLARAVNRALAGNLDVISTVTIASGATQTVLRQARYGPNTVVLLVPRSSAAAALAWWQTAAERGAVTIGHASAPSALDYYVLAFG